MKLLKPEAALALPPPVRESPVSVEKAIARRRTVRSFGPEAELALDELSQILWAAQGVTDRIEGLRAAPSAGALYPLELYAAVGGVKGLDAGVYRYQPRRHELVRTRKHDLRADLSLAASDQQWIKSAAVVLVFAAVYDRLFHRYGDRGVRYALMETGHAAQNVQLQAVALGLASAPVGAFSDREVSAVLGLEPDETPVLLIPVGKEAAAL